MGQHVGVVFYSGVPEMGWQDNFDWTALKEAAAPNSPAWVTPRGKYKQTVF